MDTPFESFDRASLVIVVGIIWIFQEKIFAVAQLSDGISVALLRFGKAVDSYTLSGLDECLVPADCPVN